MISAGTGVLLALKKNINVLQPPTQRGVSNNLAAWMPLDKLSNLALTAFQQKYPQLLNKVDCIDVRPSKGIAKVLLKEGNWEVQIDGKTGEVYSIAQRHSDWIESLHDGSIVNDTFKLISMNILGFGLIFMIGTGVWLWYGPKQYRRFKQKHLLSPAPLENPKTSHN